MYYDGQFDDSRLLINLVQTAAEQGATLLNYARVTGFTQEPDGFLDGVIAVDEESGQEFARGHAGRHQRHRPVRGRGAPPDRSGRRRR